MSKSDAGEWRARTPYGIYIGEQRCLSGRWFGQKYKTGDEKK
jgi:hypothetical protein